MVSEENIMVEINKVSIIMKNVYKFWSPLAQPRAMFSKEMFHVKCFSYIESIYSHSTPVILQSEIPKFLNYKSGTTT